MDVLTHFLVPYAAALWALGLAHQGRPDGLDSAARQHRFALALLFGLGGLAPDLDGPIGVLRHLPGLWWLQHRGISHTLIGAPVFALVPVAVLGLAAARRPQRFGRFRPRASLIAAAMMGSWTHLMLDGLTYAGVPLLFPFHGGRTSLQLFHWIVPWFFPVAVLILVLHSWRQKLRTMEMAWLGAVLVVCLVFIAGVRLHHRPEIEGAEVFPRAASNEWTVVDEVPGGWEARLWRDGAFVPGSAAFFPHDEGIDADLLRRSRATDAYKGFAMGGFGPEAIDLGSTQDGASTITFTHVAARFEAMNGPRWTPTRSYEDWGYVSFALQDGKLRVTHAGW